MAKRKKKRTDDKKTARDLAAKDLDATKAQAVTGGKVALQDISITKTTDKSSPLLL